MENELFCYKKVDGGVKITALKDKNAKSLIIREIDGESVVAIGEEAFCGTNIEDVVLSNSVKTIEKRAFFKCEKLENIVFGKGVTKIGEEAFAFCDSIVSINFPQGLLEIGEMAFNWCSSLEKIALPKSLKILGDKAFAWCKNLDKADISEDSTLKIGKEVFSHCPCGKDEKDEEFEGEETENEYVEEENKETDDKETEDEEDEGDIEDEVFKAKLSVGGVMITGVKKCDTRLVIPHKIEEKKVVAIGMYAFYEKDIESITIHGSVKLIDDCAFEGCKSLCKIDFKEGLEVINDRAFARCEKLKSLTFPESLKKIGVEAFSCCKNLSFLKIPKNVEEIGEGAFSYCLRLDSFEVDILNKNFGSIGKEGESYIYEKDGEWVDEDGNAYTASEVDFPLDEDDEEAYFGGLTVEDNKDSCDYDDYDNFYNSGAVTKDGIKVYPAGNFYPAQGELYVKKGFERILLAVPNKYKEFSLPENLEAACMVHKIAGKAFCGNLELTKIKLPMHLEEIGRKAFCDCISLEEINLYENIKEIGEDAFKGCKNLTINVWWEKGNKPEGWSDSWNSDNRPVNYGKKELKD